MTHIRVASAAPPLVEKWGVHPASGFVGNLSRTLVCSSLLEELERPQCAACRNIREVRVWRLERVDAADAAGDRDVLFSVTFPGNRLTDDSGRRLKLPENLADIDIDGDELTGERAGEDESAGGHQSAGPVRALEAGFPFALPGERIDGLQVTARLRIGKEVLALHTVVWLARLQVLDCLDRLRLIHHADSDRVHVSKASERAIRHGKPVGPARYVRIGGDLRGSVDDLLGRLGPYGPAGLEIDTAGPGDLDIGIGRNELPGRTLKHIEEAVTARLHHDFACSARRGDVSLHQRVHPVMVERIVRRHLIMPDKLARLRTQRND